MIGISAVDLAALKTAARRLVAAVGGLEAAATVCRYSKTALAAAYDPNTPDRFPPADVIADLELVAGRPIVTAVLARIAGHALVPVAPAEGLAAQALVAVFRGSSGVGEAWSEALADARVSDGERAAVVDRLLSLQAACMQAVAVLRKEREGSHELG